MVINFPTGLTGILPLFPYQCHLLIHCHVFNINRFICIDGVFSVPSLNKQKPKMTEKLKLIIDL